jgi:hypothetical protein
MLAMATSGSECCTLSRAGKTNLAKGDSGPHGIWRQEGHG